MHPGHALVFLQELSYALGILAVLTHAQMECLQAEVQQEGILGSRNAAQVAHQLCDELGGIGHLAKLLGVGQTMVGLVRSAEAGEFLFARRSTVGSGGTYMRAGVPVEVAAVYDAATDLRGMSIHILRSRVGYDIGAPLKGTAVDGCGEGVVDNEGHTMLVSYASKLLDVQNLTARVGDGLSKQRLRIWTEGGRDFLLAGLLRNEGALNAQLFQSHSEKVVCATIDFVRGDEMIASFADVEDGVEVGGLTRGCEYGAYAAFESGNLRSYNIVGGVLQTCVEIALLFQVEEVSHLFGIVILERGALVDGEHARFAIFGLPACLYAESGGFHFLFHITLYFSLFIFHLMVGRHKFVLGDDGNVQLFGFLVLAGGRGDIIVNKERCGTADGRCHLATL